MKQFYVYTLSSQKNGTLYVGVTSDIIKRVYEHKAKLRKGFTTKYNVMQLVYYEIWRKWKIDLIERNNLGWEDLYHKL